jgi:hypothetical protein
MLYKSEIVLLYINRAGREIATLATIAAAFRARVYD